MSLSGYSHNKDETQIDFHRFRIKNRILSLALDITIKVACQKEAEPKGPA